MQSLNAIKVVECYNGNHSEVVMWTVMYKLSRKVSSISKKDRDFLVAKLAKDGGCDKY